MGEIRGISKLQPPSPNYTIIYQTLSFLSLKISQILPLLPLLMADILV